MKHALFADNIPTGPIPPPPEPPKEEKPRTPDPIKDWHWLAWPEPAPKEPVKRPHTAHGTRNEGSSKTAPEVVFPGQPIVS